MNRNGTVWKWLAGVLASVLSIAVLFSCQHAVRQMARIDARFEKCEEQIVDHGKSIVGVGKDLEYIRKAVDGINKRLDEQAKKGPTG